MNLDHLKDELKQAKTLNELWDVLDKHYDLDAPLGAISKGMIINNLTKNFGLILTITRTPERAAV